MIRLDRPQLAYAVAVAAIAATTALGMALASTLVLGDVTMLYLIAIALVALLGRGPSLVAASLSVLAFDFCFVPPRFTFAVHDVRRVITFAVMFGAGLVISELTTRLRRQQHEAEVRERAARDAAEQIRREELRSALLSAVSHDLRTPLAVITGAATTLRDDDGRLSEAARRELLDSVVDDARRLERVLGNLLQLTRVESGFVPAREDIPVEEVVGGALTRMEAALAGWSVVLDVPSELTIAVDPVLFEQVLINLIDNALKHGAPPLTLRARRADGAIVIELGDGGAGVPDSLRAQLFDKFARAGTAPGAGLGLAVVRAIVAAHGGRVELVAPSTFRITLPEASP